MAPSLTNPDIHALSEAFREAASLVVDAGGSIAAERPEQVPPARLYESTQQLLALLARFENLPGKAPPELSELGDQGIQLLAAMADLASRLGLRQSHREIEHLIIPLALWLARRGARIRRLEPVVNALAAYANRITDTARLENLCTVMGEIMHAVAEEIRKDIGETAPGRPWRVLNINRGIVATRSHNPALMERAFQDLAEHFPGEAPAFFAEGMEQMVALDYPSHVREVMERHYRKRCVKPRLH